MHVKHRNVHAMHTATVWCSSETRAPAPLELYDTEKLAALGAWVLLEANFAPLQHAPIADPTPRAMSRSGRLLYRQCSPTQTVPFDVSAVFFSTDVAPGIYCGEWGYFELGSNENAKRRGTVRMLLRMLLMAYMNEVRARV